MTEYDAYGGYFLVGVNLQILLERPKDKELEWCASAFLERIVQINSPNEYFDEFQIVRSQLETIASHMCEELSEGFFLEHFIAGLEEGRKSYVKWLLPRTVDDARIYAKHYREKPFAKCYEEATIVTTVSIDSVDSYVTVVDNECEIGLTNNDFEVQVERNVVDLDCCFGENISQIEADVDSILESDVTSKLVVGPTRFSPRMVVAHFVNDPSNVEFALIVGEDDTVTFARMEGINSRHDRFTKKGKSTVKHANCLIKVLVVITEGLLPLRSSYALLWDPGGIYTKGVYIRAMVPPRPLLFPLPAHLIILIVENIKFDVKSEAFDTQFGSFYDLDNRMVYHFVQEFKQMYKKDISGNPMALRRLETVCGRAKMALTSTALTVIEIKFFEEMEIYTTATQARYEESNMGLCRNVMQSGEKCLRNAELDRSIVEDVVLVGGSTGIRKVQLLMQGFLCTKEFYKSIIPDEIVPWGKTVHAATLRGEGTPKVQDKMFLNVMSLTLKFKTVRGVMNILNPRNPKSTTRNEQVFSTYSGKKHRVLIQVYEDKLMSVERKLEMRKIINELVSHSMKLKEKREQFFRKRTHLTALVDKLKSCKNGKEITYGFVLSNIRYVAEANNKETIYMLKLDDYVRNSTHGISERLNGEKSLDGAKIRSMAHGNSLSCLEKTRELFEARKAWRSISWRSLVNGLTRNGESTRELKFFCHASVGGKFFWIPIALGFSQNGYHNQAISIFFKKLEGERPTDLTTVYALLTCTCVGALEIGVGIQKTMSRTGFKLNRCVGTVLVVLLTWAYSTETIGVMVLIHGGTKGFLMPPKVAATQVIVVLLPYKDADIQGILSAFAAFMKTFGESSTCVDVSQVQNDWADSSFSHTKSDVKWSCTFSKLPKGVG